jgi:probable O-glycosylation ligase (exosortase A-associated)
MRDLVLTAIVATLIAMIFRHPVLGAYVWAWLSLMNPHKMTYGFAFTMPFAQAAALVTLIAFLMAGNQRRAMPVGTLTALLLLLWLWMCFTSIFAVAEGTKLNERWAQVTKIQLMLLVSLCLVVQPHQLRTLIWVVALSVGFFGIKGGIWTVMTGGGGRVWGPPGGMLEGNNELAVALVMLMPIFYFLQQTDPRRWVRRLMVGAMVSIAFSILGSQSRGALLALLAMALFLGLKGKYPVRSTLLILSGVAIAVAFMPSSWSDRMETIGSYQQDTSAMSRLWTWQTLWNAALDRPIVGVGFAADNQAVFSRYAPTDPKYAIFQGAVFVAHSIYFQMLGEHGFVGLGLFLLLGLLTWLRASSLARQAAADPELAAWMPLLMRMVQVSLIGYGVGGAFLSLAYLDLPYYLVGFVVISDRIVRQRRAATSTPGTAAVAPPAAGAVGLARR